MLLVQLPTGQLHDPEDWILKHEPCFVPHVSRDDRDGKYGPNCMRPSAAEALLLHRCEVFAVDLDHHGVHKRTAVENEETYPITNTSRALCGTTHQRRALFIRDLGREGDGGERAVDDFVKLDRDVTLG